MTIAVFCFTVGLRPKRALLHLASVRDEMKQLDSIMESGIPLAEENRPHPGWMPTYVVRHFTIQFSIS